MRPEVDHTFEVIGHTDRDVTHVLPCLSAQDFIDHIGGVPKQLLELGSMRNKTSPLKLLLKRVHCRQAGVRRLGVKRDCVRGYERIGTNREKLYLALKGFDNRDDIFLFSDVALA
jgi:hypothetical protein